MAEQSATPDPKAASEQVRNPSPTDDWTLRDALHERAGLSWDRVEAAVGVVIDWLETYAAAGIADVCEPLAELEMK